MKLRDYIHQANRILLIVLLPTIILVGFDSEAVITFFFGNNYVDGAPSLKWLILSFSLLSVVVIHQTIITGCGFPTISTALTLSLLPICIVLQFSLIPPFGLVGAALASTMTYLTGAVFSLTIIYRKFHAGFSPQSTLRIVVAALLMLALELVFSGIDFPLIPKFIALILFFVFALCLLKELRLSEVRGIIGGLKERGATERE